MRITTRQIAVTAAMVAIVILLSAPPLRLGFIPFLLGVAITIIHVPVILGAVLEGPIVGLVIGFLFGLSSLFWAYVQPTGPADLYFRNPLLAIVPRLFIGPVAYLVYRLVRAPKAARSSLAPIVIVLLAVGSLVVAYATPVVANVAPTPADQAGLRLLVLVAALALTLLGLAGLYLVLRQASELAAVGAAAVAGTLTNTVLVLGMLGLLGQLGVLSPPLPWLVLLGVGVANGLPEIIAAVLICVAVVAAWKQIEFGRKGARILHQ
jgi:uncharacterized membrane protein